MKTLSTGAQGGGKNKLESIKDKKIQKKNEKEQKNKNKNPKTLQLEI